MFRIVSKKRLRELQADAAETAWLRLEIERLERDIDDSIVDVRADQETIAAERAARERAERLLIQWRDHARLVTQARCDALARLRAIGDDDGR